MAAKKRKSNKKSITPASLPTGRVAIPIAPYPSIDEPYLQSFELLRNNAYEAAFSLGRLANTFRFSQFLYYYRMLGSRLDVPPVFLNYINDCLCLLQNDTRSEVVNLLINRMNRPGIPADRDGPVDYAIFWRDSTNSEERNRIPFFRHPLSERYRFSLNSRAESGQNLAIIDQSGWLDDFELLYEKLLQGDRRLVDWMLQGWNVDRLVRPELEIELLEIYYDDPDPSPPFFAAPIAPTTNPGPFDWKRMRCTVKGYPTQDHLDRNNKARIICSLLGPSSRAIELPQSLVEFETFISNWVRRCAEEQSRTISNSKPNESLPIPIAAKGPIPIAAEEPISIAPKEPIPDSREESEQRLLLAGLRPKRRLYIFCGRIWKKFNDESVSRTDGTAKKPKIEDSFEDARQNGWSTSKELFVKHAREGIRRGKPWSDFVHGSTGEKIPLKSFLT